MRPQHRRRNSNAHIEALLNDVSALRLTLDTDLTVAAAAAESDRIDVAAEIIELDCAEVAKFAERATSKLTMASAEAEAAVADMPEQRRPTRRLRFAMAAAPVTLAAAAIIAVFGVSHTDNRVQAQSTTRPQLMATYTTFSELAASNRDPEKFAAIGRQLNNSLALLIAQAANDPRMASQALRILEAEQYLLTRNHPSGGDALLRQAQALVRQLQAKVPSSVLTLAPVPVAPHPPVLTLVVPTSSPTSDGRPTATTSPASKAPQPASTPSPQPSDASATTSPAPSPDPTFLWPFGENGHGDSH